MPRKSDRIKGYNPFQNPDRLTGKRTHKPSVPFRISPLELAKQRYDARITAPNSDIVSEQEQYIIELSPLAFQDVDGFASDAIQAIQYNNWTKNLINGMDSDDIENSNASDIEQEIAYQLMNLLKVVDMKISGGCVLNDGTSYPSEIQIISVGAARTAHYPLTDTSIPDTDLYLVVHVMSSGSGGSLDDSTYGVDIAHVDSFSGSLKVFGGKVVRDVPKPAIKVIIDGSDITAALLSNAVITDTDGDYPETTISFTTGSGTVRPITGGGSVGNVPQNCCNQDGKPPAPPTPIPTPPPTIPTPPKPKGNIDVPIACSVIQSQNGVTFSFASNDIAFGAYSFDVETHIGTAIHDWIVANVPAFDFGCDKLNYITFKLNSTYVNDKIFGLINNPFHFGGAVSPRLLNVIDISSTNKIVTPVYYFPVDREIHGFLGPVDVLFNEYAQSIHESEQKVTITPDLRTNGNVGYENLVFVEHVGDLSLSTSVNPETLDMCGLGYTPHDYYFSWLFNGTDPIKVIGTGTFIYDQYEHGRISVGTGYFEDGRGFEIDTDAVHGFGLDIDTICNLKTNGSTFYIYGKIECIQNHWGGTSVSAHVQEGGTTVCNAIETKSFSISDGIVDFVFTCNFSYLAGHSYFPRIFSSSFPDDKFLIHSIHMFLV